MINEHELWACAAQMLKQHGDRAPRHIAEQIGGLARQGDHHGVEAWRAIAGKMVQLSRPGSLH